MSLPEDEGVKEVSGSTTPGTSTLDTDILATDKFLTVIVDVHEVPISTKPGSSTVHSETLPSEKPVTAIEGEQEVTINTPPESSTVDINTLSIEKPFMAIKEVKEVSQRTTSGSTIVDPNTLATDKSVVEIKDEQTLSAHTTPGPSKVNSDILVIEKSMTAIEDVQVLSASITSGPLAMDFDISAFEKSMTAIKDPDTSPGLSAVDPNIFATEESLSASKDAQEVSHNTMPRQSSVNLDMHTSVGSTVTTGGILLSVRKKVSKMWTAMKDGRKKKKIQKQVPPSQPHQQNDDEAGRFGSNVQPLTQDRGISLSIRKKVSRSDGRKKTKIHKQVPPPQPHQDEAGRFGSNVQPLTQDRGILSSVRKKVSKMWTAMTDGRKKKQLQTQEERFGSNVQPITQGNEEILYDRTIGHSIIYEQLLQHLKKNRDCHTPELPFLWTAGHTDCSMTNTGRPYVERMLKAVGECNVPRDLQNIIKQGDFVNDNSGSDLFRMLNDLGTECDVMETNDAQFIQQLVCNGINKLLTKLRSTNVEIFEDVTAVMLGSGAEKTKIDKPDEWDFVIFLPYIWKRNKDKFYPNESYKVSNLDHREVISMLKKLNNTVSEDSTLVEALQIIVIDFLPSCMEGLEFKDACRKHPKALPVRFTCNSLEIKLDISFGLHHRNEPSTPLLIQFEKFPQRGFYILVEADCIHTTTFSEVTYMRNLPNSVRHCYQLTKCLIERFIPTVEGHGECKQSLFTSYRLKNILFYMCEYYDEEIYWSRGQWCNRIIELFLTYTMCLRYGIVNNVFSCFALSINNVKPMCGYPEITKTHLIKSLARLRPKIPDCPAYQRYRGIFYNDTGEDIFLGDIISAFCAILYNLKDPTFTVGNYLGCIPSPHTEIHSQNEMEPEDGKDKTRYRSDTYGKGLQLIQCIRMESQVNCLLMSPDHGGELLIGLEGQLGDQTDQLIKYQYNEVIQRMELPRIPMDMCYYNGNVTVIVGDNRGTTGQVLTYNYTDFSLLSSFSITDGFGSSITRLDDGCVVVANKSDKCIKKMTINGEKVCRSDNLFGSPTGLLAVRNSVVVCDFRFRCIISLSTDLQSTLFKCQIELQKPRHRPFCRNDRNGSIFVFSRESFKPILLEISDVGETIRKFPFDNFIFPRSMIYDMFRHSFTARRFDHIERFTLSE